MQGRCKGQTRTGEPCSAQPRPGRPWCAWHDPELASEQASWRAKGGAERSNARRAGKALPRDLQDVRDALLRALSGLEAGEVEPRVAGAMAAVARAVCHVQEVGDLERRLTEMEVELKREQEAREQWPVAR